jgi:hypothetical protein
MQTLVTLQM